MAESPFTLSPDPRYLYQTPLLKTAIHKLRYVVERRQGLSAVLGDVGMGKSSLVRLILGEFTVRDDYRVALIPTPSFKSDYAFLKAICREYGLPGRRSLLEQQHTLESWVLAEFLEGRNVLLLIDEAQRLDRAMLEVLRTLLNFETSERKCLQIIVSGQLELKERLDHSENRALKSRVFAPALLQPLSPQETSGMIGFRCELAGVPNLFTADAVDLIYELSGGVPRDVIKTCAIAWELRDLAGVESIDAEMIRAAAPEASLP